MQDSSLTFFVAQKKKLNKRWFGKIGWGTQTKKKKKKEMKIKECWNWKLKKAKRFQMQVIWFSYD